MGAAPALHKGGGSAGARGPPRPSASRPAGGAARPARAVRDPPVSPEPARGSSRPSGRFAPREEPARPPAPGQPRGSVSAARRAPEPAGERVPQSRESLGTRHPAGLPSAGRARAAPRPRRPAQLGRSRGLVAKAPLGDPAETGCSDLSERLGLGICLKGITAFMGFFAPPVQHRVPAAGLLVCSR